MKHPKLSEKLRAPKGIFAFVKRQVIDAHNFYSARASAVEHVFAFQRSSGLDYHQCYKYLHKLMTKDFHDCIETLNIYLSC